NLKNGDDNFWFDAEIRQKLLAQNDYIFLTKVKDEISDKLSKASAQNYLDFIKKINTLYPPTPPQSPPQIEDTQIQPLFEDVDKMIASSIRKYQTSTQQPKWIYMINPNLNIIKAIKPLIGQNQSLFIIVDTEGLYKSFDIENNLVLFSNTNIVQTKEIDKTIVLHAKKFDVKPIDIVLFETGNLSSQVLLKQLDSFATNIIYVSKYSDAYLKNLVKVLDYPSFEIINIQNFNLFAFSPKTLKAFRGCFNKIKSDLIVTDCNNKIVLDIGAGMGGDLHKYSIAKVKKLYAVEPNKAFIEQFMERLKNIISLKNKVVLINTNGTDEKGIFDVVPQNSVNVVSMMYSLTYFFESKQMLQNLVSIIDKALVSTFSTVIGTVMDGYRVDELLADKIGVDKDLFSISVVNDKKGFGKKLKVDLKQTKTAQDLTEYAVYIDLFSELLEEKGIFLTYLDDMVDCSTFNDEEKLLSSLYISFAYSRGIKVRDNLFRIKTTGDGSCLFHAVGQALVGPSYRDSVGVELRKNIASKFTLDEYNFLLDGLKGTSDFYLALEDAKELKNCKGLKQEIGDLLSQSDSPFILEKINNSLLTDEN
ncbi:MAG: hypothetical protein EBU93_05770, partial [Chlamydiae bacterium]|nr:hypothetical protein [Chlamydiota bacterium]